MTTADQGTLGPAAEGRAGDLVIENDFVRFVVQPAGSARVFGLFGGSVVDADLRRTDVTTEGNDQLTEMFPVVNFYVSTGDTVEIVKDGSDRTSAIIRVTGSGVPFPMLPQQLLDVFSVPPDLQMTLSTDYVVYPHLPVIEAVTTVTAGQDNLVLFAGGEVLMAGGVQESFTTSQDPAANFATTGPGVSYAYGTDDGEGDSLAISGVVISVSSPDTTLNTGGSVSFKRWFSVGNGGAASALAPLYDLRKLPTGTVEGTLADSGGNPAPDGTVVLTTPDDKLASTIAPSADGTYSGRVPAGDYRIYSTAPARVTTATQDLLVHAGQSHQADFTLGAPGAVSVTAREIDNVGTDLGPSPARVSLFPEAGGRLVTSLPMGAGTIDVVPGTYRVVLSRGFEYTIHDQSGVVVNAGETVAVKGDLERVVDTTGYIAADFHLHAQSSPDSTVQNSERVASLVGDGVEYAAATDHDYNTDYTPVVEAMGLTKVFASSIGVESSTIQLGHFNSWPRTVDLDNRGHGAPVWFGLAPDDLFAKIREGLDADSVVQVNHPRMSSSYFDAIQFDPTTGAASADPTEFGFVPGTNMFALDFDAIEIFNGKRTGDLFGDPNASPPELGAIYDWLAFLNLGHRFVATGNSDSHNLGQEAGYPRNYVASTSDDPSALSESELAQSVLAAKNIVCGGPFVTVQARPAGLGTPIADIGGELDLAAGPQTVDLAVRIQAPPWMDVSRIRIYQNSSTPVMTVDVPASTNVVRYDDVIPIAITADTWFVVQVEGDATLDPVIPGEKPLTFTNPVWVDLGSDGFTPPGLP